MKKDFSINIKDFKKGSEADVSAEDFWIFLKKALLQATEKTCA